LLTLGQLGSADQQSAIATIQRWAGVSAQAKPKHRAIGAEPLVRRGRALPRAVQPMGRDVASGLFAAGSAPFAVLLTV
jgi:hypothetical protein